MRVLMITGGSHGDVHPFLAIGRALRRRGHEVALLVHPYFQADVLAAGLEHRPLGEEVDLAALLRDPVLMHPTRGGPAVLRHVAEGAPAAAARLRAELQRAPPAVLVVHPICLGALQVAVECGVPAVVVQLSPMFWYRGRGGVPLLQRSPGAVREWSARALQRALLPLIVWQGDRLFGRILRRCDLPATRGALLAAFLGGQRNLGMWSPSLRARLDGDPQHGVICGFPWYDRVDRQPRLAPDLERFLAAGSPPVVFSLGTAAVHTAGDFYAIAIAACQLAGLRGVMLTGGVNELPRDLPEGIAACDYAPFSLLLGRGAATVHHGGIGSTAQALRSGRPAVVVPHAHDQFNNALWAVNRGTAQMIHRRRLTAPRLAAALRVVTRDATILARSAAMGAAIRAERDGAEVAAEEIEEVAGADGRRR